MVVSCLQTVVPPVRMEEHAIVHLPMLTVTVPVGTQDPTARTEVRKYNQGHSCEQHLNHESHHACITCF